MAIRDRWNDQTGLVTDIAFDDAVADRSDRYPGLRAFGLPLRQAEGAMLRC